MIQQLLDHIEKSCSLQADSASIIESSFEYRIYKRKDFLLTEGQRCFEKFFIIKGCVQLCFLKQNGNEQTIDFAIENWWISDFMAFALGDVAKFSIRAVEDTEVLALNA